jgi:hypothetical protein
MGDVLGFSNLAYRRQGKELQTDNKDSEIWDLAELMYNWD